MTVAERMDEDAMADATAEESEAPVKPRKTGLIVGAVLAVLGAAGGYFLATSGLLPLAGNGTESDEETAEISAEAVPEIGFVDLPPAIISVDVGDSRHLRFHAQLEVNAPYIGDVEKMKPRVMDVLNGYLRAIEVEDLEDSLALIRIRGHLLRRIEIVVGKGRVRDVLVMEFVLN